MQSKERNKDEYRGQLVALIARVNGRGEMLLLQRPQDCHCGGLWGLPGGKVEADESPLEAARRELVEETGLTGVDWRKLGECGYSYPDRRIWFHLFRCYGNDEILVDCPEAHKWIQVSELRKYSMPEANSAWLNLLCG